MHNLTQEQLDAARRRADNFIKQAAKGGSPKPPKPPKSSMGIGGHLAIGAGTALTAMAIPAIIDAVQDARVRSSKDKYLNKMKRVHPGLKNISREDLDIAYDSLAQHAPEVLRDPLLGGQILKQMAEYRTADLNTLNQVSNLRKGRVEAYAKGPYGHALASPIVRGVSDASKEFMAPTPAPEPKS